MQRCPACGQENPAGFRLCGMCGAALTAEAPPAHEERKVVTVLFTDLVGFTSRSEQLDPEDVRATLSPYYSRLRAEIERHGGTVEKFIGDAVMAVFGAPVAHEDDPERAVRAALAIHAAIDDLQIRTAVNTGEALVALGARPDEGEGIVSGDVVNTTARLQSAAPVNGILVGQSTYRATRDAIEYREALAVEAKGKAEPVPVWEVVGARAAFGADVEERLRTPLVGRERERGLLADALTRARVEESAQLVTLVGVPGIGKSRLVAELFQLVEADPELIAWRQGRSLPYGESVSFWALGEIVKSQAGILETDDAEAAQAKLTAMLESLATDDQERAWLETHARPLVGLEGMERPDREAAFSAWRRVLEAVAEQRPLVVVFEDLHWADDGLLDFVDHLAEWATTVPLLIVATARPELLDRRPGWGGGKRNAFTLSIGALTDDETARLLQHLLDRSVLPSEDQQEVLRRAEGNPLYAEEYARMLQDRRGDEELPLPQSIQGLIAARIDGLPSEEKTVLQEAAVIGKVFWPGAVAGPDANALHALERKEFVRRDRRSSIAGETQYAFLHALVRDVAYGQIPRARRVELHRRAAEWIDGLATDRADDRADMRAHHYGAALELATAAGLDTSTLRPSAKHAFADAAQRALALNGSGSAADLARSALELADDDDPLRPQLQLTLATAGARIDRFDFDLAVQARDGFLALGDVENAARAEILAGWISFHTMRPGGVDRIKNAVALLEGRAPSPLQALALARLARRTCFAGEPTQAIELARRALALAEEFGDDRTGSDALNTIGLAKSNLGDESGLDDLRESINRGDRANAVEETGTAWNNLTNCLWGFGRLAEASEALAASLEFSQRLGFLSAIRWMEAEAVLDHYLRGNLRAVIAGSDAVLARTDSAERYTEIGTRSARSVALAAHGRVGEALEDARVAMERAHTIGDPQVLTPAHMCRAFALHAAGDTAAARSELETLLSDRRLVVQEDWLSVVPLLALELGRSELYLSAIADARRTTAWTEAGLAAARGELTEAAELNARIGARFNEAWARLLAAERGESGRLEQARRYFDEEGASPFLRRCKALMSASA